MNRSIEDVKCINFNVFTDNNIGWQWGSLVPINLNEDIPFEVNRIFYVYYVGDVQQRGQHAHYKNEQILICLNGKCGVVCKDGINEKNYVLDSPSMGLYIPEMIWDEQFYYTKDTVLLVLCSMKYDREDYIEDWNEYVARNTR